ncbi:MAG: hypothetical protein COA45_04275 [Zetaproteobacteria bacterium]|nr:MAG: hypothetical protein COA45_04275 [Zetaproteobacteria bacterium]
MGNDDILSLQRVWAAIRRGQRFIVVSVAAFLGAAMLYVSLATPQYTAMTSILLDPMQAKTVAELSSKAQRGFENAAIVSQVEIIKSRHVAERALQYLYSEEERSAVSGDFAKKERLLAQLRRNLRVYREGESYVLNIRYTTSDPQIAASRANAFAQAYIYEQIHSFSEDSEKTSQWLKMKIEELRQQSIHANIAIQKFRVQNNLVSAGGRSVTEQQLFNINSKLGDAKAATASAYVKYEHSREIIGRNDVSAAVAEAFDNDVINNIRQQYISDQQRLLKLTRTLGREHEAVKGLKTEIEEAQNVIFSEMKRIAQSYKNKYEVALAKETSLEQSLGKLIDLKVRNDGQIFELEALEKEADVYKQLYNDYLAKFEKINQQASFPIAESRVITKAMAPLGKSHPKSFLILVMSLILGGGFGVFLALLSDSFDKSFKRAGQVESAAGLFFLGFFPAMAASTFRKNSDLSLFSDVEYAHSVLSPLSLQAESCRNIKTTLDKKSDAGQCQIIGVISDTLNTGKSVTASNLALFIAQSKKKCLLIDADLRNPVLSKSNFSLSKGLAFALSDKKLGKDVLHHDPKTNLYVLPADKNSKALASSVHADSMKALLESCKDSFDYIIIDLSPLSATSDASGLSALIDHFLLVLEWGKSKPNSLNFHLKQSGISKDKVLGVILAQANMKQMVQKYDHHIYSEYTTI